MRHLTLLFVFVTSGLGCKCGESTVDGVVDEEPLIASEVESSEGETEGETLPAGDDAQALTLEPTSEDPEKGEFSLKEATTGLSGKGTLIATIDTTKGVLTCKLEEKKAPVTVANFVGLARGLRPWWNAKEAKWVKTPYYEGTSFHRVIENFMIQGGDYLGDGTGGVGYTIENEQDDSLKHDREGVMAMANRGRDTNGAQFYITHAPAGHLDGGYTVFGFCEPAGVIDAIATAEQSGPPRNKPIEEVTIKRVTVERKGS